MIKRLKARQKVKKLFQLKKIISRLKKKRKKIVFTNGCFDILHPGHIRLFEKAKSYGDVLVVGINSDSSVRRLKGNKRPLTLEMARAEVVASAGSVDYVIIFAEDTPYKTIKHLRPDILVKGSDYRRSQIVGADLVKRVVRFPLVSGFSTSSLIRKCQ
ncbi:MAG: adenylyltransferase/cytidyltransferase family protein [Elusimicrobiota bacterium]